MESAHPHGAGVYVLMILTEQLIQPRTHFTRSLVGKGHRHHRIRRQLLYLNQPGNTMYQHASFTAARTGQNQLITRGRRNRFALSLVKALKEMREFHEHLHLDRE